MKLLVINPNTTLSMTDQIAQTARDMARPGTEIIAVQPRQGPSSIQGFHDVAQCQPGVLDIAADHSDADAVIVACFDDTGVDALRCTPSSMRPSSASARRPRISHPWFPAAFP